MGRINAVNKKAVSLEQELAERERRHAIELSSIKTTAKDLEDTLEQSFHEFAPPWRS